MIRYKEYGIKPNDCGGYMMGVVKLDKKGKEALYNCCYPSTLAHAVKTIRDREFAKSIENRDLTLIEAVKELRALDEEIKATLKEACD